MKMSSMKFSGLCSFLLAFAGFGCALLSYYVWLGFSLCRPTVYLLCFPLSLSFWTFLPPYPPSWACGSTSSVGAGLYLQRSVCVRTSYVRECMCLWHSVRVTLVWKPIHIYLYLHFSLWEWCHEYCAGISNVLWLPKTAMLLHLRDPNLHLIQIPPPATHLRIRR